jgi:hypothetical protein
MTVFLQALPPLLFLLGWLGPAAWMYRDANRRLRDQRRPAQLLAAGVVLPVLAPVAWALLRPPETLEERHERELARRHLEQLLEPAERCLVCRTPLDERYVCCPACATEVRRRCDGCSEPVEFTWSACPYCGQRTREDAPVVRLTA